MGLGEQNGWTVQPTGESLTCSSDSLAVFVIVIVVLFFFFVLFFEQRLLPQDPGKSRISLQRTHHVLACWKRYVTGVEVEVSKARAIAS